MMDFILIPLVVGIITAGIYGLFELFARRKERLAIIEKIGDRLEASAFEGKLGLPSYMRNFSFSALKIGSMMAGIGLGLLVAFFISLGVENNGGMPSNGWGHREYASVVYGASVLLFGGIGLLVAFVVEMNLAKKK
ncbi:DUF6249 domain-containing protein [Parabacteroides sp. PF5-6]|uniref:DUF6249 domain-containing protein n=1 Tax=Parabacteroides sp. PF5-6 TaxID=1742403 RepID=UPI002406DAFD|nr:DUF6249 domain-containing protein [Parabacteroides sp. PF5-6]MDF9829302.1 hypothetical protein [Parabacteroides sp. PF5-6]